MDQPIRKTPASQIRAGFWRPQKVPGINLSSVLEQQKSLEEDPGGREHIVTILIVIMVQMF